MTQWIVGDGKKGWDINVEKKVVLRGRVHKLIGMFFDIVIVHPQRSRAADMRSSAAAHHQFGCELVLVQKTYQWQCGPGLVSAAADDQTKISRLFLAHIVHFFDSVAFFMVFESLVLPNEFV